MHLEGKGINNLVADLAYIFQSNHCTHMSWTASANNVRGIDFTKTRAEVENKGERKMSPCRLANREDGGWKEQSNPGEKPKRSKNMPLRSPPFL